MNIYHADTCLPDYFAGSSFPVLAIPVTESVTHGELAEMLTEEFNSQEFWIDGNPVEFTDKQWKDALDNLLQDDRELPVSAFHGIEQSENDESVYAFFVLEAN